MNKSENSASFKTYLQLGKFSVMIPVSLTAFTGFFLFNPLLDHHIFLVFTGVLLQGMAASSLNQLQEISADARMDRTKNRPLPSRKISKQNALVFTVISFISGSILLYFGGNLLAILLGLLTILWYNGVYTPLKKRTAFAVIPGSFTGAIPPVIGWVSAGGNITDKTSILLAFLFFIGQIPHFWLLMLKYGHQYKEAGMPSLTEVFSIRQINNLSFTWISASMISALMLSAFGIIRHAAPGIALAFFTLAGLLVFRGLINNDSGEGRKKHFLYLNLYYLLLMILLILDRIIG